MLATTAAAMLCAAATATLSGDGGSDAPPPPGSGMARLIEWNCPLQGQMQTPPPDPSPGALVADGNYVWFVTRIDPRVVRLTPGTPKHSATAICDWWELDPATVTTGGLRLKPYGSQVFVRGITDVQRIESATSRRTRWVDGLLTFSDVAIASGPSSVSVFTTGTLLNPIGTLPGSIIEDPTAPLLNTGGVVQRLTPLSNGAATVKRWEVGASVGLVELSGVDVHPMYSHKVYFSEPTENMIGELDTNTSKVRRWNLNALLGVSTPRQLDVAHSGVISFVTVSGHLVTLNPSTNEAVVYPIPTAGMALPLGDPANNPFGVDADGVVGFTAGGPAPGFNKIGFLSPGKPLMVQTLTPSTPVKVFAEMLTIDAIKMTIPAFTGAALKVVKNVPATETAVNGGTIVEANIDMGTFETMPACGPTLEFPDDPCVPSTAPQGVASDPKGPVGSFYAAIGDSFLRVAHVTLPLPAGGLVTGNGYVQFTHPVTGAPAGTGHFTLNASKSSPTAVPRGSLTFNYPDGKAISVTLTSLTFSGSTATIEGLCKAGSNCTTFKVTVQDGASSDAFQIIRDPVLGLGAAQGGTVQGGTVKFYRYQ